MRPATTLPQGVPPDAGIYIGNLYTTPRTIAMWREQAKAYPMLVQALREAVADLRRHEATQSAHEANQVLRELGETE